jgi:hypothetical protein
LLGSAFKLSFLFDAFRMLSSSFGLLSLAHLLLKHICIFKLLPLFLNNGT